MVGDRLNTDMLFGANNGMQTLLTLTGVSTVADMEKGIANKEGKIIHPDFYVDSVADFFRS